MKSTIYILLGALVGIFVVGLLVTASIWPVINVVETGKTPQYPEIQPQYYSTEPRRIFEESAASVEAITNWTLIESEPTTHVISAEAEHKLGFVDDITIDIKPVTEFVAQVHVRSASRVGKGDFGQNARNIRLFFSELDGRLGAVKFDPATLSGEPDEGEDGEDK